MAELRASSIGIEDIQKYFDALSYSLSMEQQELRSLRLPIPEDIDRHGLLFSFKNRKEAMLKDREKMAVEQLQAFALKHGLADDINLKEMVGEHGTKITKDNFTIVKGLVLQVIDKKMIEESIRRNQGAVNPLDKGR